MMMKRRELVKTGYDRMLPEARKLKPARLRREQFACNAVARRMAHRQRRNFGSDSSWRSMLLAFSGIVVF